MSKTWRVCIILVALCLSVLVMYRESPQPQHRKTLVPHPDNLVAPLQLKDNKAIYYNEDPKSHVLYCSDVDLDKGLLVFKPCAEGDESKVPAELH